MPYARGVFTEIGDGKGVHADALLVRGGALLDDPCGGAGLILAQRVEYQGVARPPVLAEVNLWDRPAQQRFHLRPRDPGPIDELLRRHIGDIALLLAQLPNGVEDTVIERRFGLRPNAVGDQREYGGRAVRNQVRERLGLPDVIPRHTVTATRLDVGAAPLELGCTVRLGLRTRRPGLDIGRLALGRHRGATRLLIRGTRFGLGNARLRGARPGTVEVPTIGALRLAIEDTDPCGLVLLDTVIRGAVGAARLDDAWHALVGIGGWRHSGCLAARGSGIRLGGPIRLGRPGVTLRDRREVGTLVPCRAPIRLCHSKFRGRFGCLGQPVATRHGGIVGAGTRIVQRRIVAALARLDRSVCRLGAALLGTRRVVHGSLGPIRHVGGSGACAAVLRLSDNAGVLVEVALRGGLLSRLGCRGRCALLPRGDTGATRGGIDRGADTGAAGIGHGTVGLPTGRGAALRDTSFRRPGASFRGEVGPAFLRGRRSLWPSTRIRCLRSGIS
ncbi:hypothetical protein GCM10023319_24260 [Nocardia iowensis]